LTALTSRGRAEEPYILRFPQDSSGRWFAVSNTYMTCNQRSIKNSGKMLSTNNMYVAVHTGVATGSARGNLTTASRMTEQLASILQLLQDRTDRHYATNRIM